MLFDTAARYFLEVARTGSIAMAAEQLHVASSAISRQISKLEDALGCPLFERRARGMVLSGAGARLAAYVRNSALEGERVLEELRDGASRTQHVIRIACTDGFAGGLLAETMAGFRRANPECSFLVQVSSPEGVSGMVARGEADVGMKFSVSPERGVRVEHQQPAPVRLVVAATHALAGRRTVRLRDVVGLSLALPAQGTTLRHLLELKFQAEGMRLQGAYSGSLATLLPLVVQGEAVLFASMASVSVLVSAGQLSTLALPELDAHARQLQILTHDEASASPLRAAFCHHLVAAVMDHG